MNTTPDPEHIDLTIYTAISQSQDMLFERFDKLHTKGIHDNDVIRTLRKGGYKDLAESYIEWSGALDPDAEDDNTTTNPAVPDPGDSPTNALIAEAHRTGTVLAAMLANLRHQREEGDVYVDEDDPADAIIDGHVDLQQLALSIAKAVQA